MVEANSVIPLYKQIVRALSDSIANGTYRPGDKLPTETELIEQFGVSRITVRSAIKEMDGQIMVLHIVLILQSWQVLRMAFTAGKI